MTVGSVPCGPAKSVVDAWQPPAALLECERTASGDVESALTIFLIGRECPFTCVFCDLWRHTLDESTPVGSLPSQIDAALTAHGTANVVKLYNAANFFDPRSVPDADLEAIVARVADFDRVTVESHPLFVGERCLRLAETLDHRLEVAMGLETAHPRVLPLLNKKMRLETFDRAAAQLRGANVGIRAFVLVGVPFLSAGEQVEWAVRSVEHAAAQGAGCVALIPVRGGNGEMERLRTAGEWAPPSLEMLEEALERVIETPGVVVTADTWDLERLPGCDICGEQRRARLEWMNLNGRPAPRRACPSCGWS